MTGLERNIEALKNRIAALKAELDAYGNPVDNSKLIALLEKILSSISKLKKD